MPRHSIRSEGPITGPRGDAATCEVDGSTNGHTISGDPDLVGGTRITCERGHQVRAPRETTYEDCLRQAVRNLQA